MRSTSIVALALCVLAAVACTPPRGTAPETQEARSRLTFMAGYKAQANLPFVAAYVANDLGYFARNGLNVEIQHAVGQGEHLKLLLQGAVDVTTADADSVLKRRADQNLPIVAIALFSPRGNQAYAVLADSDIHSPNDFEGKTVGYKLYQSPDYLAMLERAGVDRSRIDEVSVGFDPRILTERRVDVYPVFTSNEPDLLQRVGVATRLLDPADYGVPTLGLTYISRKELVDQQPELLARFLDAAQQGIDAARASPELATDIVMRYAPQEDRGHQRSMVDVELAMATGPDGSAWSLRSSAEQWRALHDTLLKYGGLERRVDSESAYTNAILDRAAYVRANSRTAPR